MDLGGDINIAASTSIDGPSNYTGGCEAELLNLYRVTYFPFLNQTCGTCHTNGPGIGQFGHTDLNTSYFAFKSISRASVNRNIINPNHQPPYTGTQNQGTLDAFTPGWVAAEATYAACTGSSVAGSGIVTLGKTNPAIVASTNPNTWTRLTWNLSSEIRNTALMGRIPLTIGIEARVAVINGVRQGYEFRNPTVRVNAGFTGPYQGSTLRLYINNNLLSNITTYNSLTFDINSATDVNIAPGYSYALAAMTPVAATDSFAIEFADIRTGGTSIGNPGAPPTPPPTPTLPATVTLAQLLSNDATLGVFRQSCVGCHSAGNPAGGLDITNPALARAQANSIYSRMTNANSPMPTAGLLLPEKRELVRIWRDTGAN